MRPAAVFWADQPLGVGIGEVVVLRRQLGAVGREPEALDAWSKTFVQVAPCSSSGSQWSKRGSLGVLMRTLSAGLLPGNAANAGAAINSSEHRDQRYATERAHPLQAQPSFSRTDAVRDPIPLWLPLGLPTPSRGAL